MSHADVIDRFFRDAGTDRPRFLRPRSSNVLVSNDGRALWSYGSHFTMCRLMPAPDSFESRDLAFDGSAGWWLVNGDTYSSSTSKHQNLMRDALRMDSRPSLLVSFDAVRSAGIVWESIVPIEALPDRYVNVTRSAATVDAIPEHVRQTSRVVTWVNECNEDECDGGPGCPTRFSRYGSRVDVTPTPDRYTLNETTGRWEWTESRHVLGESVFSADVRTTVRDGEGRAVDMTYRATFLSAFDHQESHLHYFLAELPAGASPHAFPSRLPMNRTWRIRSVDDGFAALRPESVNRADARGIPVVRQGDVFAIACPTVTTNALKANGYTIEKSGRFAATSHVATRLATSPDGSMVYGLGILHHRPEGFRDARTDPGHARQVLGDRETWHALVRNTVPRASVGSRSADRESDRPRSWTRGGNVD